MALLLLTGIGKKFKSVYVSVLFDFPDCLVKGDESHTVKSPHTQALEREITHSW